MNFALRSRILACKTLPSLPAVALEVLELCRSDDTDLTLIAEAIAHDPALATRLLRVANSAALGARGQVTTLHRAVALLGTQATLATVLTFSLVRDVGGGRWGGLDLTAFWRRAILAGLAGEVLGSRTPFEPEELFLACLLQDVGVLALHAALGEVYASIHRSAEGDHDRLVALERAALGTDHGEVTWFLAQHWRLPGLFQQGALFSHDLDQAQGSDPALRGVLECVYLSGRLADACTDGLPPAIARRALDDAAARIGAVPDAVEGALRHVAAAMPEVAGELGVDLGDPGRVHAVLAEASAVREARGAPALPEPGAARPEDPAVREHQRAHRAVAAAFETARARGQPLTLALCAVDGGQEHDADGLARIVGACLRENDFMAAAGSAVLAVLPGTATRGGLVLAQRMRRCAAAEFRSLSLGVVTYEPGAHYQDVDELIDAAGHALEAAQADGLGRLAYQGAGGKPVIQTDC